GVLVHPTVRCTAAALVLRRELQQRELPAPADAAVRVPEPGVLHAGLPVAAAARQDRASPSRKYRAMSLVGDLKAASGAAPAEITRYWRPDLVACLLGCSFTFEAAMRHAGLPVRHIDEGRNVSMYVTSIPCRPAGPFHGPMVVSMRPLSMPQIARAVLVTGRYPRAHGAPIHVGDPEKIGIRDLARPEFGDPTRIAPVELPVFWACGVTPQAVAQAARVDFMITHAPGHMFITDLLDEDLAAG